MRRSRSSSSRSASSGRPVERLVRAGCAIALIIPAVSLAGTAVAAAATAVAAPAAAAKATPATALTSDQALAKARRSGKKVPVPGATTATSTLTANPDGTLTTVQSVAPVRKYLAGKWKALDPTLHVNPDGSLSTAVTSSDLTLSGGGSAPLARLNAAGRTMSISAPATLPAPVVKGAQATYKNVLDGVDLQVTANAQGGFSEALVVRNARAAANPALQSLTMPVTTGRGLSLSSDKGGNITVSDAAGQPAFTAPTPLMWDSKPSISSAVRNPVTGRSVDARTGDPVNSSSEGPGESARTAGLAARATSRAITLSPSHSLLTSASTVFPVYIDPTWNPDPAPSKRNSWTMVNSDFTSTSYWKTSDQLQVGDNAWDAPYFVARSFFNVSVPSQIYGATVTSSTMTIAEEWSPSCTAKPVELWHTGSISSSTTWANQPGWTSKIDSVTAAHGYDSSCKAANIGFDTTSIMTTAASAKWTNLTVGLRAADEGDKYGWKKFSDSIASFSTTYDHPPSTPTTLTTSPATSCTGTVGTVGDGNVSLYAKVSDPDGDHVGASFAVTKAATGASIVTSSNATALTSGSTAVYVLPRATLESVAAGAVTKISWRVQVTDYKFLSAWSTTCSFNFDPTRTGAPSLADPGGEVIGSPATFSITPPASGTAPTSYSYQLNGAAPVSIPVVSGQTPQFTVPPPRYTDTLTVTGVTAGGNVGDSAVLVFNATAGPTAVDGDLTGDGIPDVLGIGATNGLPSGLWLTQGQAGSGHVSGDGQVITTATDLGKYGDGLNGTNPGPADFNGAQAISGHFTGSGLQDVLTYFPSGSNAGNGSILNGNGDGSPIQAQDSGSQHSLYDLFTDYNGLNNDNPLQIVNAGNTSHRNLAYPDLLAINGDATAGYYLEYYPNDDLNPATGGYSVSTDLTTPAPDGTMNWNSWTLASAQTPAGMSLFLWNTTTHALYLWAGSSYDYGTATFSPGTQYLISSNWNPAAGASIQAADINGDGVVDVWATTPGPTVTAYLVTNLSTSGPASMTAQSTQTLLTGNHSWQLNDPASGTLTTAADATGSLPLTGGSGVTSNSGDLFSPDALFDGTTTAAMHTTGPALATNADFTVSAWVKPTTAGGVVFAQEDTHTSGVSLYIDGATKKWTVAMATSDSTAPADDVLFGSVAQVGVWTHVAVTYKASTGTLALYLHGIDNVRMQHTTKINTAGQFHVGEHLTSGQTGQFNGQIANVQVWNQTLDPTELAQQSGTPGYVLFESDDTNYASGSSWTTAHGKLTFTAGLLSIIETNKANKTVTYGASGHSAGVLTVQKDGNAVIYPTATHSGTSLWASATSGHPDDVMFFQPDGNLVVYNTDGTVLWASNTYN